MSDPLFRTLAALPSADPNPARADRVRARCRGVLVGKRRPSRASVSRGRLQAARRRGANRFWGPLAASVGGIYLVEVIRRVVELYAMR